MSEQVLPRVQLPPMNVEVVEELSALATEAGWANVGLELHQFATGEKSASRSQVEVLEAENARLKRELGEEEAARRDHENYAAEYLTGRERARQDHDKLEAENVELRVQLTESQSIRESDVTAFCEMEVHAEEERERADKLQVELDEAKEEFDGIANDCENMAAEQDEAGNEATREWHRGQADAYRDAAERLRTAQSDPEVPSVKLEAENVELREMMSAEVAFLRQVERGAKDTEQERIHRFANELADRLEALGAKGGQQ